LLNWFETHPRRVFGGVALVCVAMLAFGLYLQHGLGLEPCPMCIVQRYALILVAVCAALAGATARKGLMLGFGGVALLFAGFGAFVAARQSWLQWYPPEIVSCGRDFYGMIETFPLKRAVPMIFKGSGVSFFTSTWLLRSQLYLRLRASGSQSGSTCTKPRFKNQCMVRVVSTKMLSSPMARARCSMRLSTFSPSPWPWLWVTR
jgi:disulfide bond formation protein DsbB